MCPESLPLLKKVDPVAFKHIRSLPSAQFELQQSAEQLRGTNALVLDGSVGPEAVQGSDLLHLCGLGPVVRVVQVVSTASQVRTEEGLEGCMHSPFSLLKEKKGFHKRAQKKGIHKK